MAFLQRKQYGIKEEAHTTVRPSDDIARLMYYFNCVCSVIQYNDADVSRLRDCNKWASLSQQDIRLLFVLCATLPPDVLNSKVFFHSDAMCGNDSNRFFEINQLSNQLLIADSILVASRQYRVTYTNSSNSSSCVIS